MYLKPTARTVWPIKIEVIFEFLVQTGAYCPWLQEAHTIFHKRFDSFEILHITCSLLVRVQCPLNAQDNKISSTYKKTHPKAIYKMLAFFSKGVNY